MKIYIIRHGEAYHQTSGSQIIDPDLTDKGVKQCQDFIFSRPEVDLILTSNLTRCVQSALLIYGDKKIHSTDILSEFNTGTGCNIRKNIKDIKSRYPMLDCETYRIPDLPKETEWEDGIERAKRLKCLLKSLKWKVPSVALVTHAHFIRCITTVIAGTRDEKELDNTGVIVMNM